MRKERIYQYINNELNETEFLLIYSNPRIRKNEIFSGYIRLYHPLREIKEKHDEQSSYGIFVHTKQKGDIKIFKNSKIYKAFKDWT